MITRDEIVTALAGAGFAASPVMPDTPGPGSAWPRWRSTAPLNGRADGPRETLWYVFVGVTNAIAEASVEEAEPIVGRVIEALLGLVGADGSQLAVDLVEPVQVPIAESGTSFSALRFTARD